MRRSCRKPVSNRGQLGRLPPVRDGSTASRLDPSRHRPTCREGRPRTVSARTQPHAEPGSACALACPGLAVGAHPAAACVPTAEDALLIVSELVTNAVRHGKPDIVLSVDISAERIRIEVRDGNDAATDAPADGTGGRSADRARIVDRGRDGIGLGRRQDRRAGQARLGRGPRRRDRRPDAMTCTERPGLRGAAPVRRDRRGDPARVSRRGRHPACSTTPCANWSST